MEGLIGREWVNFSDVVAILGNFSQEEFLAVKSGPYLLEIPLEQGEVDPSEAGSGRRDSGGLERPTTRGRADTTRIPRPGAEGTRTFSVQDLLARKRRKAEPRILFLGGHARTVLGRSAECDVRIFGNAVSRRHVEIQRGNDGNWSISDLGSSNGTLLDGRGLTAQLPVVLREQPLIQIGDWRGVVLFPRGLWDLAERLRGSQ